MVKIANPNPNPNPKPYLLSNLEKMLKKVSSKRDLNPGPLAVQASTLPTQPQRHRCQ